ncbi:MAG: alpha/beta hydrolase [Bermanella sp.]
MEQIIIDGQAGALQGVLHPSLGSGDFLIVCHPHPLFDGTMDNKVVTTVARTYLDLGVNVLRFNFRGVGRSAGQYGEISGEVQDCQSAVRWLLAHYDVQRLFLAGFSFGAYVAAKVAYELKQDHASLTLEHLLLVAPSVLNSPFELATPLACPTTVLMGGQDEVVPYQEVSDWCDGLYPPAEFIDFPEASHFFHGQLVRMKKEIKRSLAPHF